MEYPGCPAHPLEIVFSAIVVLMLQIEGCIYIYFDVANRGLYLRVEMGIEGKNVKQ